MQIFSYLNSFFIDSSPHPLTTELDQISQKILSCKSPKEYSGKLSAICDKIIKSQPYDQTAALTN
jgi:hypothetical protein